jgi:hypothetical protein
MSKLEPKDLIQSIIDNTQFEFKKIEQEKLINNISKIDIEKNLNRILNDYPDINSLENDLIKNGTISCILGSLYAFSDRGLEPFDIRHIHLYKILIHDIKEAYNIVSTGDLDKDLWMFETFDYGIKQVYYLDWKLYLSQICY